MRSFRLPSRYGKIHASWLGQQATIGSLRHVAEVLGGKAGDYLFIEVLPRPALGFRLVKRDEVERATGLQRLQMEIGNPVSNTSETALGRIAGALGLNGDSSITAIRHRLHARAEGDLVSLLPAETGSEHQDALQELLDLVGG